MWHTLTVVCLVSHVCAQLPPGSVSGGSTAGVSSGGSGPMPPTPGTVSGGSGPTGSGTGGIRPPIGTLPFLQMRPHAPNAIHHVGISYNLLKGNPDGEYWSTGKYTVD